MLPRYSVVANPSQWGSVMHTCVAAGAAFLLAVLWFDLMFDVQTRKRIENPLPPEVLASISAYYRRVTTDAYPMNRLVALVMATCSPKTPPPRGGRGLGLRMPAGRAPRCVGNGSPKSRSSGS